MQSSAVAARRSLIGVKSNPQAIDGAEYQARDPGRLFQDFDPVETPRGRRKKLAHLQLRQHMTNAMMYTRAEGQRPVVGAGEVEPVGVLIGIRIAVSSRDE